MQSNPNNTFMNLWPRYWPRILIIIIGVAQMILAWIILGLQCGIVYVGIVEACSDVTARHVMGYVCWAFFFASSIANCCVSCCNRLSFACATYGLVENILTFIFSCVLIDFNRKFIDDPEYDHEFQSSTSYYDCFGSSSNKRDDVESVSLSMNKAQLSAGVFMLLSSIAYMALYLYTGIRAWMASDNRPTMNFNFSSSNPPPPMAMMQQGQQMQYPYQPGQHMQHPQQPATKHLAPPGFYAQPQQMPGYFHQHQHQNLANVNEYAINTPTRPPKEQDAKTGSF